MAEDFGDRSPAESTVEPGEPKWGPKTLAFLAAMREFPTVAYAARAAGVSRESHYRRIKRNPRYLAAFKDAERIGVGAIEHEAIRRAVNGVRKLVIYHGEPVMIPADPRKPKGKKVPLYEVEYSDALMVHVLRAKMPELYVERVRQEVSGVNGGPVNGRLVIEFVKSDGNGSVAPAVPGDSVAPVPAPSE